MTLLKGGLPDGALLQTAKPATEVEFITALTPCLQLCAPVGMSEQDRKTWFDAAYIALRHLPADILRYGALSAMQSADHPSKIVPIIIAATKERYATRRELHDVADKYHALSAPDRDNRSPEERAAVAQTMGQLLKRMEQTAPDLDALINRKPTVSG